MRRLHEFNSIFQQEKAAIKAALDRKAQD